MKKVRFGILGTAKIARQKVIPAMQQGQYVSMDAIASRRPERAEEVARQLGIVRPYGSYEELLADPDLDAVYIPLPNHLHVRWSQAALEAGKHVLCEKPIGLSAGEAQELLDVSREHPDLKIMEAFMYRHHPRWQRTKKLVEEGAIGELRAIHSLFTYYNDDPTNVRNRSDMGGGGLMDIGCYSISLSRWLFGREPENAHGVMKDDPRFGVDRLTSGVLDFGAGTSVFTCSTQAFKHQYVRIYGSEGYLEMDRPFNQNPKEDTRLIVRANGASEAILFPPCNQFTLQGDQFARTILDDTEVPTPLDDAVANMRVIDMIRS